MARKGQLATIDVDFGALDGMKKAMKRFPGVIVEELGKAVTELVLLIESEAKRRCPVDTGNLRSSITPVVESWAAGYVGTNVQYAPFVEYGTKHMAAQPYLEPAFIEGKRRAKDIFEKAMSRAISRYERSAK